MIAVGLSMDAFAVAVVKGLSMKKMDVKKATVIGFYFGFFQALMPITGYFFGSIFSKYIIAFDHYVAFFLLALIGAKMIKESFEKDDAAENGGDVSVSFKTMLPFAVATSIDALAVGVTFSFLQVKIFSSAFFIAVVTFSLSVLGVKVGSVFGTKFKSRAEFFGGLVLIAIGTKILLEHLGIINF